MSLTVQWALRLFHVRIAKAARVAFSFGVAVVDTNVLGAVYSGISISTRLKVYIDEC